MSEQTSVSSSLEGLPRQFVQSLKILFDILDEDRSGFVKIADIEAHWNEKDVTGLPSGVIDALRKVSPANGCLSFERFVVGLRLALFRNKHNNSNSKLTNINSHRLISHSVSNGDINSNLTTTTKTSDHDNSLTDTDINQNSSSSRCVHIASASSSSLTSADITNGFPDNANVIKKFRSENDVRNAENFDRLHNVSRGHNPSLQHRWSLLGSNNTVSNNGQSGPVTATVKPNNFLNERDLRNLRNLRNNSPDTSNKPAVKKDFIQSPPRPERPSEVLWKGGPHVNFHSQDTGSGKSDLNGPPQIPPRDYKKSDIIHELKQWQLGKLNNQSGLSPTKDSSNTTNVHISSRELDSHKKNGLDNNDDYVNIEQLKSLVSVSQDNLLAANNAQVKLRNRNNSGDHHVRRDARRHTLANGIDYNMIKRMKQLEQERDGLLQGLQIAERLIAWYLSQLHAVEDRQRNISMAPHNDYAVEANAERMNFQVARISDVNQHIKALIDSSKKGFPIHMNLAVRSSPSDDVLAISVLKDQSRTLTRELGQKTDRIAQLEREKASLIRELFQAQSKKKNFNYDDTTFI